MDTIKGLFNFDNIGDKLKTWAKWSCWISILLIWIGAAIMFLIFLFTSGMLLFALLTPVAAAVESLLIWVGNWVLYALGQYVEDVHVIRQKQESVVENAAVTTYATQNSGATNPYSKPNAAPISGGWTCKCGRNHAAYVSSCICGTTKAEMKVKNSQSN